MVAGPKTHDVTRGVLVRSELQRIAGGQGCPVVRVERSLRISCSHLAAYLTRLADRLGADHEPASFAVRDNLEGCRTSARTAGLERERGTQVFGRADQGSVRPRRHDLQELAGWLAIGAGLAPHTQAQHQPALPSWSPSCTGCESIASGAVVPRPAIRAKSVTTSSRSARQHRRHRWPLMTSLNRTTARVSRPR